MAAFDEEKLPSSERLETLKRAFWVGLIPGAVLFAVLQVASHARAHVIGVDAHAYWAAVRLPETWYTSPPGYRDAFLYSPAFAQAVWPLAQLPWPAFELVWGVLDVAVLAWLLAPLGWRRAFPLAPFFIAETLLGNVYLLFAGALVWSLGRRPGALAFPALTKIAPGVAGLWFVARREWRSAIEVVGVTLLVVTASVLITPNAWWSWLRFLAHTSEQRGVGAPLRLAVALVIVLWAARRGRAWLLAPALMLACPVLAGFGPVAVLAAIPRLRQMERDGVFSFGRPPRGSEDDPAVTPAAA